MNWREVSLRTPKISPKTITKNRHSLPFVKKFHEEALTYLLEPRAKYGFCTTNTSEEGLSKTMRSYFATMLSGKFEVCMAKLFDIDNCLREAKSHGAPQRAMICMCTGKTRNMSLLHWVFWLFDLTGVRAISLKISCVHANCVVSGKRAGDKRDVWANGRQVRQLRQKAKRHLSVSQSPLFWGGFWARASVKGQEASETKS